MRPKSNIKGFIPAAVLGLILLGSATSVRAITDRIIATFDADISVTHDDGGIAKTLAWSQTNAPSSPAGGSLYVTVNYPVATGWNDSKVGITDPAPAGDFAWPGIDCTLYANLEFDVMVDQANSHPAVNGSYGGVQVVFQGWAGANGNPSDIGWVPIAAPTLANVSGWQHMVVSLTPYPHNLNKLVLNFFTNPGTNSISCWVDNIKLTAPPAPPPTLQIAKAPPAGLTCIASKSGDTYQRQIIRTLDNSYSFHSTTAPSNTTTYSLTIADFPAKAYSGYIAQMFLVPQYVHNDFNQTNMQFGPTDSSIDWNSGSVIYWVIGQNANGKAYSDFRVKTNEFSQQHMAFDDAPFGTYPNGHLAAFGVNSGVIGTWTLSINNNTNVTIIAPDASQTNFVMNPDWADYFQSYVYAYVGIQPNDNARIGQSTTFSRVRIAGSLAEIDDDFVSAGPPYTLNSSIWTKSAADGQGILINPPDAKLWLKWSTPDSGFSTVYTTDDITKRVANNEWIDLVRPPSSWTTVNDKHMIIIRQSDLDAAFGYSPTQAFFQLWKIAQ